MSTLRIPLLAVFLVAPVTAHAQPISAWSGDGVARMRLVAGAPDNAGRLRAGIEIRLQPGWKTYWKNPGAMGLPPHFEWSGSENVARVEVRWPAPRRIGEHGDAIGYSGTVILPLSVVPEDPAKPARLALTAEYGVCEKICVPASASAMLDLEPGGEVDPLAALTLGGFEERVPIEAAIGGQGDPAVVSVRADAGGDALLVEIETAVPSDRVDVFGESEGGIETGLSRRLESAPNRFELKLHEGRPGADGGLAIVVVAGERAVRVRVPENLAPAPR